MFHQSFTHASDVQIIKLCGSISQECLLAFSNQRTPLYNYVSGQSRRGLLAQLTVSVCIAACVTLLATYMVEHVPSASVRGVGRYSFEVKCRNSWAGVL